MRLYSTLLLGTVLAALGEPAFAEVPVNAGASAAAVRDVEQWLQLPAERRPPLNDQAFAKAALSRIDADKVQRMLWEDFVTRAKSERAKEWKDRRISAAGKTMIFDVRIFGVKPPAGRSLFISLHGGGSTPKRVNDGQWENQKRLYKPAEGVYIAPRAPTDAWNMWHQPHMGPLFERLIADAVLFEEVNPDRVYLTGYSAGGDGVYRMAPRLADRWAAAAMMAGHPGEASPLSLRNLPFAIHVGERDDGFARNKRAAEWGEKLAALHRADPDGYENEVVLHAGKGHWMDREDAAAIPWMAKHNRNPIPPRVVWKPDSSSGKEFYWLAVAVLPPAPRDDETKPSENFEVTATIHGQRIVAQVAGFKVLTIRLRDGMLDLDKPLEVEINGRAVFHGPVARTAAIIAKTLAEREDPGLIFSSELKISVESAARDK